MSLKLAIVSPFPEDPNTIVGGVDAVSVHLSRALCDKYGVEVHVVAPSSGRYPSCTNWNGVTIHRITTSFLPGFIDYWSIYRRRIHAKLQEITPDITHFQAIAGWTIGYNKSYVLTIHGINEKDILYKGGPLVSLRSKIISIVETKGRKKAKNAIIISPYVFEELKGQIRGRIWAIENPVPDKLFDLVRKNSQAQVFFAGAVIERKNVLGLIKAFHRVLENCPLATLRIAGPLSQKFYANTCKDYVKHSGLQDKVFFLGSLNNHRMRQELSKASCLTLVSFQETAPVIIEEAMAAGVPVLGSRICGIPYLVEEGKTGFLVNPRSLQEIASKLEILLRNKKINAVMSNNCKEIARQRFHVNAVADHTLKVYKAVLNRSHHNLS